MRLLLDDILGRPSWACLQPDLDRLGRDPSWGDRLASELWSREELHGRALGELLPGLDLATGPAPAARVESVRTSNVMMRARLRTWEALASVTPLDIRIIPNCGVKTAREILRIALLGWADALEPAATSVTLEPFQSSDAERVGEGSWSVPTAEQRFAPVAAAAMRILTELWLEAGTETISEALALVASGAAPSIAAEIEPALAQLRLDEVLQLPVADEGTWRALLTFEERQRRVLEDRILVARDNRATLDELGGQLGVTRERIRQLELTISNELQRRLGQPELAGIRHLGRRAVAKIGDVAAPADVEEVIARLVAGTSELGAADAPQRRAILLRLAGPYSEIAGLWWTAAATGRLRALERRIGSLRDGESIDPDEFTTALRELGAGDQLHDQISAHLGVRDCAGRIIRWHGSMADLAVAVLGAHERPMSLDEIHEQIGFERSPRSLAGQVQGDARMMRVGKDAYGLQAWGGTEYAGIVDAIEREIDESGGSIELSLLVDRLCAAHGVSENSVRSYASGRRFIRRPDGRLAVRGPDDPEPRTDTAFVDTTRGAFLLDGVWHLKVEVDHESLRGSGRMLPKGIAQAAGLEPDLTLGFHFDGGSVTFSWSGNQPMMGSIRPILHAHACVESDLVFLPLDGAEPRPVRVVRIAERAVARGTQRLAIEFGLDPDEVGIATLAAAIGLPAGADWEDIRDRLTDRGESWLLALDGVPSA